jgi:peptide/nickel transport system substrate-binding protein
MRQWIAALAGLGLCLAGSAEAATRGGTFVFGASADCIFLDPVYEQQNPDIWFAMNVYDTLLQPSADGKTLQPGLASSYVVSQDGRTVTLTLRRGIRFGDGSPIEPSDVKFSLDRGRSREEGGNYYFLLSSLDSVEIAGAEQVVLHLKHPDPAILQVLASFYTGIVPEKLLQAAPGANLREKAKAFAERPIGSGPYMMTSWAHGSEFTLSRNPYYWKKGEDGKPLPYLDKVKVVIVPDDATRILKLRAGEVDAAEFVPFSRVAELKADPKLDMALYPAAKIVFISMNNRPALKDGTKNPLADKRVRQALNYAVEKKAIAQIMTYGIGVSQVTLPPSSTPLAMTDKGEPYPYAPAKAKALLQEAGYGNGFDLTIYTIAGSADDAAEVAALQQMWSAVGVRLRIQQFDAATRIAKFKVDDYQMRTGLFTNDLNDPSQITSFMAYFPSYESNRSGFRDAELEELFLKSQTEMDVEKRRALYRRMQEIYIDAAPMVFLLEVPYPVALAKKVKDFVQIPLGNYIFESVHLEP